MNAKVVFGEEIRLWHFPTQNRYQHLVSFVEKTFNCKNDYILQYEDSEMDKVTICNEQDLLDAFECVQQENRPSLKIFIIHEVKEHQETKETSCNDVKDKEEGIGLKPEAEKLNCCEMVLEFLLDETINQLLPELVRRVIHVLHEKMINNEESSLGEVVFDVLEEDMFAPIVCHELYQKYVKELLPGLLEQFSCMKHVLLSINEEAVGTWVSDMINLVVMSLGLGEDENNGLWDMYTHMNSCSNQEAIHNGVKCDGCGVYPIRGIRYKCSVCVNFDLCSECESLQKHYDGHPLVKINQPIGGQHGRSNHFAGLEEMTNRGRRCHGRSNHFAGFQEMTNRGKRCHGRKCHRRDSGWEMPPLHGFGHCGGFGSGSESGHCSRFGSGSGSGRRCRNPCWMKYAFGESMCHDEDNHKCKLQKRKEKIDGKIIQSECQIGRKTTK